MLHWDGSQCHGLSYQWGTQSKKSMKPQPEDFETSLTRITTIWFISLTKACTFYTLCRKQLETFHLSSPLWPVKPFDSTNYINCCHPQWFADIRIHENVDTRRRAPHNQEKTNGQDTPPTCKTYQMHISKRFIGFLERPRETCVSQRNQM